MTNEPARDHRPIEDIADDAESNADETTRREAFEQALDESDRSDEGANVGDQMD
jgi:hypothetical protein